MMCQSIVAMVGVCCALALATFCGRVLSQSVSSLKAHSLASNWNARVHTWWVMVTLGGGALLAGPGALLTLFAVISFLSLREFCSSLSGGAGIRPLLVGCFYVLLPMQYGLIALGAVTYSTMFLPALVILSVPLCMALLPSCRGMGIRLAELGVGLLVCVYGLSYAAILLIPGDGETAGERIPRLLFLVLISQSSDVFQFLWGKALGRHLLAPRISPRKTVEGLLGGLFSATILGTVLWQMTPFSIWQAGIVAFLIGLSGSLGGLLLSAVKRSRAIKDWGTLLPGHGGMLDRVDSLWLSAPVYCFLLTQIGGT